MEVIKYLVLLVVFIRCSDGSAKLLSAYWGQDSAGSLKLPLEKDISYYCNNFEYDIIPIAFLNVFFDFSNKDNFPGMDLADHCDTTFQGYPTLLNCPEIGLQIQQCQKAGKKILLSLGGPAGLYYFSSSSQAVQFANTIWNLFLDGESTVRPFHEAVLDGVDLDIEGGTTTYYADFVRTIRSLMNTSERKYLITGAPQCPYPDVIMGPGSSSQVLEAIAQEFDYLFVQFYNNHCSLDHTSSFETSITKWFDFAAATRAKYGKGPLIFIGLPAHSSISGYQKPEVVKSAWDSVKDNNNLGGIMLWDASFDLNNVINGRHYSTFMKSIIG